MAMPTAFPIVASSKEIVEEGMTLRDYFAAQCLSGLCARDPFDAKQIANIAYGIADAMLKQRDAK